MDLLDRLQVFARVAELRSFTQAALALDLPKGSVSLAVQQLESQLGTRLLQRTTRRVALTADGQAYYERCKDLISDVDDLQTMFHQQSEQGLRGRVRIDMSTGMARHVVVPQLPALLLQHPGLELELSSTERRVDLIREGFDCVLRTGEVLEQQLIARPLGHTLLVNCASPAYVQAHGLPRSVADLAEHRLIHFVSTLGSAPVGFEWLDTSAATPTLQRLSMPSNVTVNNAEAYVASCLAGLGIIQVPRLGVVEMLAQGRLVQVLPQMQAPPMALSLLYAHRRHVPRRVRVVMDWLGQVVQDYLRTEAP